MLLARTDPKYGTWSYITDDFSYRHDLGTYSKKGGVVIKARPEVFNTSLWYPSCVNCKANLLGRQRVPRNAYYHFCDFCVFREPKDYELMLTYYTRDELIDEGYRRMDDDPTASARRTE